MNTTQVSQMSPSVARFVRRWHPELVTAGIWRLADDDGHHLRKHYFTQQSADAACVGIIQPNPAR